MSDDLRLHQICDRTLIARLSTVWFRRAAEQGDAYGQSSLGYLYDTGRGVPQDPGEAAAWYRRAAEQGNADAPQANLDSLYASGRRVPQDHGEAGLLSLGNAAEGQDAARIACLDIALPPEAATEFDLRGMDWDSLDPVAAIEACDTAYALLPDDPAVQTAYGRALYKQDGLAEAARLFRAAADQGYAPAQSSLGYLCDTGRGVPQDPGEAAALYRRAAEQGEAYGQGSLGYLYDTGRGVPQGHCQVDDYAEAR